MIVIRNMWPAGYEAYLEHTVDLIAGGWHFLDWLCKDVKYTIIWIFSHGSVIMIQNNTDDKKTIDANKWIYMAR